MGSAITEPTTESSLEAASYVQEFSESWLLDSQAISLTYAVDGFQGIQAATVDSHIDPQLLENTADTHRIAVQVSDPSKCPALKGIPNAKQIRSIEIETGFSSKQGGNVLAIRMLDADGGLFALPTTLPKLQTEAGIAKGIIRSIRDFKHTNEKGHSSRQTAIDLRPRLGRLLDKAKTPRSSEQIAGTLMDHFLQKANFIDAQSFAQLILEVIGDGKKVYVAAMPEALMGFDSFLKVTRTRYGGAGDDVVIWDPKEPLAAHSHELELNMAEIFGYGVKPHEISLYISIPTTMYEASKNAKKGGHEDIPLHFIDIVIHQSQVVDVVCHHSAFADSNQQKVNLPETFDSSPQETRLQIEAAIDATLPVKLRDTWRENLEKLLQETSTGRA